MKACTKCKKLKPLSEFNWKRKKENIKQSACRECQNKTQHDYYCKSKEYYIKKAKDRLKIKTIEWRKFLLIYFETHPCVDCGETDPVVLTFDHVRGTKLGNVTAIYYMYAWQTILDEIDKCEIRCFNCHVKRHAHLNGNFELAAGSSGEPASLIS
jgi:hypothetical protein